MSNYNLYTVELMDPPLATVLFCAFITGGFPLRLGFYFRWM